MVKILDKSRVGEDDLVENYELMTAYVVNVMRDCESIADIHVPSCKEHRVRVSSWVCCTYVLVCAASEL